MSSYARITRRCHSDAQWLTTRPVEMRVCMHPADRLTDFLCAHVTHKRFDQFRSFKDCRKALGTVCIFASAVVLIQVLLQVWEYLVDPRGCFLEIFRYREKDTRIVCAHFSDQQFSGAYDPVISIRNVFFKACGLLGIFMHIFSSRW